MRTALILGLAIGASRALAQDLGVYTGVAIGEFDHTNETAGAFSETVSSWKIYAGFQFGESFSLEVGRASPSAIEVDAPGSPLSIATRRFGVAQRVDFGLTTFRVMGRLPLRRLDLWAAYGSVYMDADVGFTTFMGNTGSISIEDTNELWALGVDWQLGDGASPFDVRLEYESLGFPFSDAFTISVGVAYRFTGL
jgi:hypothetical protein